jgi:signal transduction histidine kinase
MGLEDILRLAKADAAKATIYKTEVHIVDLITGLLEPFRPQFDERGIKVETHFIGGANRVRVDLDKMSQVITNLLQNIFQYTLPGGKATISTEYMPGELKVVFANTGGEIAETDLPFIFERFYRGEKSRSREHGGAGIGLAIVKELVEAHGGMVGAEVSSGEVRIWFTLPASNSVTMP